MRETQAERGVRRLVLAGALAFGLVAGGGAAWAFWVTTGQATGSSVKSGTLDLTVNGQAVGTGQPFTLTGLQPAAGFFPGTTAAVLLTLGNAGTTPLHVTSGTLNVTGTLAAQYTTRVVLWGGVVSGTTCTGGSATPPTTALAPNVTETVCVEVGLSATAPDSQGQTATATVTFQVSQ